MSVSRFKTSYSMFLSLMLVILLLIPVSASDPTEHEEFEPFFSIFDTIPTSNTGGKVLREIIADALSHIGIDARVKFEPDGFSRLFNAPLTHEEGGFDYSTTAVYFESVFNRIGCNIKLRGWTCIPEALFGYNTTEIYDLYSTFLSSFDEEERAQAYQSYRELQREENIWLELGRRLSTLAFSPSFELSKEQQIGMAVSMVESDIFSNGWTEIENNRGNTIRVADMFRRSDSAIKFLPAQYSMEVNLNNAFNMVSMVYQGLYERDYQNDFKWTPLLAASHPILSHNNTIVTVKLKQNVTFADGVPMTATDVVESYKMLYKHGKSDGFFFWDNFFGVESFAAIDPYTVQFNFTYANPYFLETLKIPIVPTHIWGNYTEVAPIVDVFNTLIEDLRAKNGSRYGYGTGPYVFAGLSTEEDIFLQNVTLTANPNYWNGEILAPRVVVENYLGLQDHVIPDLISNRVQIATENTLGYHPFLKQVDLIFQLDQYSIPYVRVPFHAQHVLLINMYHPILGTGVDTPLGKEDPSQAARAANSIRKAINHAVPRVYLSRTPPPKGSGSYSSQLDEFPSILDYEYNILDAEFNYTLGRHFMTQAGYQFPEEVVERGPTSFQTNPISIPTETQTTQFPASLLAVMMIVIRVVYLKKEVANN